VNQLIIHGYAVKTSTSERKSRLRGNDGNAQFSLCYRLNAGRLAVTGIFSFAAISVTSSKPRQFMLITKKTFLQQTSHGVAWDLVRFDIDGKEHTISTVRQQNSHKEIIT